MIGWVKLHRKLLNWEWYSDIPCRVLFLHLLIKVNYEDSKYQGVDIKAGSCAAGYPSLAEQTGLTIQQIRTAMKKLISTNEITVNKQPKFSVITLNKWVEHQQDNSQVTVNQQDINSQSTTSKEIKNKEIKNKETILDDEFEAFWKQTKFPKRSQDTKGDMKKKFIKLIKNEKLTYEEILKASNNFAIKHEGDNWSIGMRRFLDSKENIDPYLHNTELALEEKEREQRLAYEATLQEIEY